MKRLRKISSLIVTTVIVIIVFVLTLLNIFSSNNKISTNVDTSYEIQNYTLNLVVTNENKVKVEEELIVNFNKIGKHGIYRNIPLENTLTINENNKTKKVTQSVEIFDLKGNQNAVKTYSNNNVVIRFGSEHSFQPANEPVKFELSYTMNLGKDYVKTFDMFYFNLLGIDWDCNIQNFNFSITMPNNFEKENLKMFYGEYGKTNSFSNFSVNQNVIIGSATSIKPHNALTINLTLPENYFNDAEYIRHGVSTVAMWFCVVGAIVSLVLFFIKPKNEPLVCPVEFYSPDGLNPVDVASIYNGKITTYDITTLLIYFASKKYLKIEVNNQQEIVLTKIKNINEKKCKSYEIDLFNKLFENGNTINLSHLDETNEVIKYIDKNGQVKTKQTNKITDNDLPLTIYNSVQIADVLKPVKQRYNKLGTIFAIISMCLAYVGICFYLLGAEVCRVGNGSVLLMIASTISLLLILALLYAFRYKSYGKTSLFKMLLWFAVLIFMGLFVIIVLFGIKNVSYTFGYYGIIIAITTSVSILLSMFMPSFTKEQNKFLGRVLGFKNFLVKCEKSRMDILLKDNPEYFYDVLPYAYVFGITTEFVDRFESLGYVIPQNTYFGSDLGSYILFSNILSHNLSSLSNKSFSQYISKTSGMSGGFRGGGFSGGGFSGGGFGGGGGGSW